MSQIKSQLISFILYKPLQVTLSRNTGLVKYGKSNNKPKMAYSRNLLETSKRQETDKTRERQERN